MTTISDRLLVRAASEYVYDISRFYLYEDPILYVREKIKKDFNDRYLIRHLENKEFIRDDKQINLRYLIIEDTTSLECALIFQGSDGDITSMFSGQDNDWSNNLNLAAKLNSDNYLLALEEFKYLKYDLKYNITALSGNSLGGGYALFVKEHYKDLRVIGLNPAPNILDGRYTFDEQSTILLISSDMLSRSLILDESRINNTDACYFEEVYGFKPYIVKRTIPQISEDNVHLAHVGVMNNYRKILLKLYSDNALYYNSKILIEGSEKTDFAKMSFKRLYAELNQSELIKYCDFSIYPILSNSDKSIVDTFMNYPSINEFLFFDLMSDNLLNYSKKSFVEAKSLIRNFSINNDQFKEAANFFINNSKYELMKLNDKPSPLYNSPKLLVDKIGFSVNFDLSYAKYFVSLPQSVRLRIISLLEANVLRFINLNAKLSKSYDIKSDISNDILVSYSDGLLENLNTVDLMFNDLVCDLKKFSDDTLSLINSNKFYKFNNTHNKLEKRVYEFNESILNYNLIELQDLKVSDALDVIMEDLQLISSDTAFALDELFETIERELNDSLDKEESSKLYLQIKSLRKNVDFKSFIPNLIVEYREDIIAYLLSGSTALCVKYNMLQLSELIGNYQLLLDNLDSYMNRILFRRNYKKFQFNLNLINSSLLDIIDKLNLIYKKD